MAVNVTIVGNMTGDPELRFVNDGTPVASFSVAENTRALDRNTNEWKETNTTFYRVTVWRDQAQNVTDSLVKGTRVVVSGKLVQREYKTADNATRYSLDVTADEIAPSLRWAKAKVEKITSGGGSGTFNANSSINKTQPTNNTAQSTNNTAQSANSTSSSTQNVEKKDSPSDDPWANEVDPDF